jgi:glycosyltransferase involved in cell wall biosynthesis
VYTGVLGFLALVWLLQAIEIARGVPTIPSVDAMPPLVDADCPTVSILLAARDEAEKLPAALDTLLTQDYPRYEVIAVDDRSEDATTEILAAAAKKTAHLKVVRVDQLPAGWLGKPHGLQQGYEQSSGEWLIFTDADVHFAPDALRRSLALAQAQGWDHMTLLANVEMSSAGERIVLTFFAMSVLLAVRPWRVSDPRSRFYAGVGAFQLVGRGVYETAGTHRRLRMEVVDDMKLGKIVKAAGAHSGVAKAVKSVSVRWHAGVGNIVRGTTKNFFAAAEFKLWLMALQLAALLLMFILPWVALPFSRGWTLAFAAIAAFVPIIAEAGVALEFGLSPLYAFTAPIGALIFFWMLLRSTIVTLWQGGIYWRGTFYPLKDLKRGVA